MSNTVIKVNNLSKRYRIGLQEKSSDTFIGQVTNLIKSPIDNFRQLRSLSKFKEDDESVFWALKDINFEVQQGEVLGIIGHNGAGKSTLLKILSRITEPSGGEIRVKGRVSALLEVGTGFHSELTGRENVYMNGTILGMTRQEINRKFDEIIDFSGVEKYIDTPVKFYSSGMKVRLGFAVAAHLEPEILIIDEVLAVGDAEFQKKCLGKMESISEEGRTVIFVSHDLSAVTKLCPNSILLKSGELYCKNKTGEVIGTYLNDFNASGKLKIKDYQITLFLINDQENVNGVVVNAIEPINIIIKINSKTGLIQNPVVKFYFRNSSGVILFIVSNLYSNIDFVCSHATEVEISCLLPYNPLLIGDYYLDVEFRNEYKKEFTLQNICKLHVVESQSKPINNAKLINEGILVSAKWHAK